MRLLSWNIHKGIGGRDRLYRLERIIEVIEAENPDLICLQEVDRLVHRSSHDDQPRLLSSYFRCDAVYQPTVHVRAGCYGNLILSRWPLRSRHRVSLRLNARKPRGAQLVVVDSPEGVFSLVQTHLGLSQRERSWQIERLLGHVLFRSAEPLPGILVGDFNDWLNTLAAPLLKHGGFRQITSPISKFRSFPAWLAVASLDKAFVRGALSVRQCRIVKTSLTKIASDHLPLVVDFHLHP